MRHSTAEGYIKNTSRLNEEEENTGTRFNEPATNLATRHKMANRQHEEAALLLQQQQQYSITEQQQQRQQHSVSIQN